MNNALITTDLHLTGQPRDAYRWGLFAWLLEQIRVHNVKTLFLLGDITDAKDYHSSTLVNMVVDVLTELHDNSGVIIYIVRGNHDGLNPDCPYFRFLSKFKFIRFVQTPFMQEFEGKKVLMLPHTKDPIRDWEAAPMYEADYIFMHATVHGAISENGHELGGVTHDIFRRAPHATIYSGDVHVPQRSGRIEYIGTPYQVRFGTQRHNCRVLLLKGFKTASDLHFETLWRYIIDVKPQDGKVSWPDGLRPGDQIKVKLHLAPHEYADWHKYREQVMKLAEEQEIELCGLTLEKIKPRVQLKAPQQIAMKKPTEILKHFCTQQKVDTSLAKAGEDILSSVT